MIARDIKRSKLINKYSNKRQELKIATKKVSNFREQLEIQKMFQSLPKNSSHIRLRKRCWATGRSRGYFRVFGLSRHVLREMAHDCLIPGLKKSSW